MTNKKRISKLLKKKYRPSERPRKVKYFKDFKFGIDFGSLNSDMAAAFNQLAEVAAEFTTIDLRGWQPPVIHPIKPPSPIYMRNPFLVYPDKPEPTLPELKRRVDDLEYILKNTRVGTERWLENLRRLRKARIDFESMWEKKGKPGIAEMLKDVTDKFVTDLERYRSKIFEYNFEKEYLSRPIPKKPIVDMLENSLLKTKQYRDWRYPRNIFKEGLTTFEKKGETMSGDIIYTCKLTEDGFRYEIDFINKIHHTEIIGERRIRLPKYKAFW
ncbi:hypothetical protein AB670_02550 [Chryseobacterium sp. MOF25P]|uniref:hypothetical protein n=1 Tax=unclassified Chryseobacterium TaxID=2593645 RepID=UPI000805369B|nr:MULTISPECIES: hypothetical protein [unclassified Chryseobacterium]MBO6183069.1 hypothetical protein [Chryseobacterium sp.]OBW41099.1 hypothetical protein AB670_02550 [Chryseobacterium sp. MOF25P]OBW45771.1 hypothetical protein AB671_02179 [Chryseobacterium sp. BGARF1]